VSGSLAGGDTRRSWGGRPKGSIDRLQGLLKKTLSVAARRRASEIQLEITNMIERLGADQTANERHLPAIVPRVWSLRRRNR
jgi:hypothetical protein